MSVFFNVRISAAMLFVGTMALLTASPAHAWGWLTPRTASATAEAWYTITSAGWTYGNCEITDDGGNYYQAGGPQHPLVSARVLHGGPDLTQEGTVTYVQHFVWTGGGVPGNLAYSSNIKVSGSIEYPNQSAHANSQTRITVSINGGQPIDLINKVDLNIPMGTEAPFEDWKQPPASNAGANATDVAGGDWTTTAIVEADVSTP